VELDLRALFELDTPVLEIIIRGTVTYLLVFLLLRTVVKQAVGGVNLADILLIVMIADAAQNAMAGTYESISDGLILVATLAFWSYTIDWLGVRVPFIGRLTHPPPIEIVKDGSEIKRTMRKEMITHEELMSQVRLAGAETIEEVRRAWVEGNGEISIVIYENGGTNHAPKKHVGV
jgi:uncharacterized membrane protein YcaP (DUF421 family)